MRKQFHWQRLDQLHLERKRQNKISEMCQNSHSKLLYLAVPSSHSRTHRKKTDSTRNAGPRHTSQLVPWRMFVQFDIHIECWTHRRRSRSSWNQTHSIFHTIEPMEFRRRRILWWSHETRKSSLQNRDGSTLKNAFYCIHLGRAQKNGIAFCHTKSHAINTNSTAPPDCVERVISQRGEMTFYQRSSTARAVPRIVLRSAWNE